jgi:Tfp pilus assembly protein PilN
MPVLNLVLSLALAVFLGSLGTANYFQNHTEAEITHLQTEKQKVNHHLEQRLQLLGEVKQMENTADELTFEVAEIKNEYQKVLNRDSGFVSDLKILTEAIPDDSYFTTINIGAKQITMEGIADNPFAVVSYVTNLETSDNYSEVGITWIGADDINEDNTIEAETRNIPFRIIINK